MKIDRCPKAYISECGNVAYIIRDVRRYEETHTLPDAGGWLDQHPHWTEAAEIVRQACERLERDAKKGDTKP